MRRLWTTAILVCASIVGRSMAAEPVIGFRGDGSGYFADADPPTRFSAQGNLRWKADVGQGCGAAIIVGNRVFMQAAPNALVCLDKASGKELWRRTHHVGQLDTDLPACRLDAVTEQVGEMHQLKQRMHRLDPDSPEYERLENELDRKLAALPEKLPRLPGAGVSTEQRQNGGGYSSLGHYLVCMTPCSDGRRVVAVFPTGIVAAYDFEGRLLWNLALKMSASAKRGGAPNILSTCPIFTAEGVVVVRFGSLIAGIEAEAGKEVWRVLSEHRGSQASPVAGTVAGETFVGTDAGDVLRARDGLVVYQGRIRSSECSVSPVFADGVFHWVTSAVKVTPGSPPQARVLWHWDEEALISASRGGKDDVTGFPYSGSDLGGQIDFTSPIVVRGRLLYYGWGCMNVIDAATGQLTAQHRLRKPPLRPLSRGITKNWAYGGMIRAGERLIVIHDNGLVKIIPINDTFAPQQFCALPEDVYAQPTADGPALYIRSLNALWRFDHPPHNNGG